MTSAGRMLRELSLMAQRLDDEAGSHDDQSRSGEPLDRVAAVRGPLGRVAVELRAVRDSATSCPACGYVGDGECRC